MGKLFVVFLQIFFIWKNIKNCEIKKSYILLEIRVISEDSKIKLKLTHTRFHWLLLGAFTLWKSANFIHKSRFDLFFCWLARLKKMIEEMLIMQIKVHLKVCQVHLLYILNSTKTIKEIFFQYSKASMRFNKKKLLNTLTSEWISDRCLYYFTFILVININENVKQCSCQNLSIIFNHTLATDRVQQKSESFLWDLIGYVELTWSILEFIDICKLCATPLLHKEKLQ